ncbi:DNA polymerase IV [Agrococcus casei]|uniref:DNA polymerase IV n=1 Tax=Agrococcus casei LMG 22410 TaxID=1255656 RepID=A0A1R4FS83_9MICO|nr:DNA polymerase IV [Agrococcus casei]SJM58824.1 DNA polymerase IV [Agrococcus casei LMG 22410]
MSKQDGTDRLVSTPDVDDRGATVLHVDLDAFFASASLLDKPHLRELPVVIGHDTTRSVVTAATYEARRYGVHSAMPMARAKQLCPQAVIIDGDFDLYRRLSKQVMGVLHDVSPEVEQLGIDEAFVFVAGAAKLLGRPFDIATGIRRRVHDETGLVASIGASSNRFIAKLASMRAKPDGLLVIPPSEITRFLHPQPISAMWGVGPATEKKLSRYGLRTVQDIAETPLERLQQWIGSAGGARLHELAWGRDERSGVAEREREKSIGHDHTFRDSVTDPVGLRSELARLAGGVGKRLRAAGLAGRTVTIRVRYDDFTTLSRSKTLPRATDVTRQITETAWALLDAMGPQPPVRLLGVQASSLGEPGDGGDTLFDDEDFTEDPGWSAAERAVDRLQERFGSDAVRPASALRLGRKREDFGRGDS